MATVFMESGTDATQGLEFYSVVNGSVVSNTSLANTGPRSIQCIAGPTASAYVQTATIWTGTSGRITFYLNVSTLPATATIAVCLIGTAGGVTIWRVRLTTGGVLQLW